MRQNQLSTNRNNTGISNSVDIAKRAAAIEAVKHIRDGSVIGLGSGSTAAVVIEEIGARIRKENLRVYGVPTSYQALYLALRQGVKPVSLEEYPQLEMTIDGADQVDKNMNLLKGGGAALVRERIVASYSKQYIVVVDSTKVVDKLGGPQPLPVEVTPFASTPVLKRLQQYGEKVVLRECDGKLGPLLTDNGNFIADLFIRQITHPSVLRRDILAIPGVIDCGLFVDMPLTVYVGIDDGSVKRLP